MCIRYKKYVLYTILQKSLSFVNKYGYCICKLGSFYEEDRHLKHIFSIEILKYQMSENDLS